MAACTLKIELDEPSATRLGGDTVAGTVIVTTTGQVKCDGLNVSMYWTTHGRGNVEKGEVDRKVLFEGTWDPQREYRYPFQLRCAVWPPTYYGTYVNVSHFVAAQAKVPWSSDPKVQREITVVAREAPADLKPTRLTSSRSTPWIGWLIAIVLVLIFGAMFFMLLMILLPIVGVGAAGYWFFRVFLPRRMLGKVEFQAEPAQVVAGTSVTGQLRFTPPRTATTDGIGWTVTCTEKCESGSGSDRKTHRHEVLRLHQQVAEAGTFAAGQPQAFAFTTTLPADAPVSLKFRDNQLQWQGELRIAIPRWPDWVKTMPLTVLPTGAAVSLVRGQQAASSGDQDGMPPVPASEEAWFAQMLDQVERSSDDPGRLRMVLDAVQGQVFSLRVDLSSDATEGPAQAMPEPGTWTFALYRPHDVEFCLFWPAPLRPPTQGRANWRGQATVIGYDDALGCLLMRVAPQATTPRSAG
ncbi:MAG: sporulation protein [Pirellulaceae bacterium]|jgi:hypothetical protein|nr:sporulation protein [Pirellulaceae bacterium]